MSSQLPQQHGRILILASPSGGGKSTMKARLTEFIPDLHFSVSATTRKPRPGETHGKEYFFLSDQEFDAALQKGEFLEWETVYNGIRYGTLRSQVDHYLEKGYIILFDVDVLGALSIKDAYGSNALAIYLKPPSQQVLRERLQKRGTETEDQIKERLNRAEMELSTIPKFDVVVVNDDLERAWTELKTVTEQFIS